jgi:hypothetical protein
MSKKNPAPPPPLISNGKNCSRSLSLLFGHYLSALLIKGLLSLVGIINTSSNDCFVTVTEANIIVSVLLLQSLRHK